MSGKVIISSLLVLSIWSIMSSAEIAPIIACLDAELSVNIDNQKVNYYGVEMYYRYDTDKISVRYNPNHYYNFNLDDARVIFRGVPISDVDPKYSVKKETIIEVNTKGVAARLSKTNNGSSLRGCSITLKKSAADVSGIPDSVIDKVLDNVSRCLTLQLCQALGTFSNDKVIVDKN